MRIQLMGEMADFTNDQFGIWDQEHLDYLEPDYRPEHTFMCRCCKMDGLVWKMFKGNCRLFDIRGIHNCLVNPLKDKTE